MFSDVRKRVKKAGQPPGTAVYTGDKKGTEPVITVITFSPTDCVEKTGTQMSQCQIDAKSNEITWINVEGLHDEKAVQEVADRFSLHPLTVEDILNVEQRPKVEEFDGYIYITLKVLNWDSKVTEFTVKQISLVLGSNFILTFQELDTTLFDAIRKRIQESPNQRLRQQGSDYLAYRLIDAIVDQYFIVLEALGDQIEVLEDRIITAPTPQNARTIYKLKRQMLMLRKAIWPMREALSHLLYAEDTLISKFTHLYLRDVYDHTVQAIDTIETFRDVLSGMLDMYLSSLTIRMNEIMKTLTIITTIFIPIAAIAGVYGMNIPGIPLMQSPFGFPVVFSMMTFVAVFMLFYFRKKKWI